MVVVNVPLLKRKPYEQKECERSVKTTDKKLVNFSIQAMKRNSTKLSKEKSNDKVNNYFNIQQKVGCWVTS